MPPDPAAPNPFHPLPRNEASPSELDENPRFLHLPHFTSRFLPGSRNVFAYLPEAYFADPTRRFPVFYLHDAQNLIDGRTSYIADRTWRINTTADALTATGEIEPIIVIGIANTGVRRMAEYTPTRDSRMGGGAGPRYGRLLIEDLRPLIDTHFRTLPDASNTALGGSSLGGLITLALALDRPDVFGKAAVLSPSVWWNQRSLLNRVSASHPSPGPRIWLDMGTAEGLRHLRDTDLLYSRLKLRGWHDEPGSPQNLHYLRVPGGLHEENAWANRFDQVLRFLFPAT